MVIEYTGAVYVVGCRLMKDNPRLQGQGVEQVLQHFVILKPFINLCFAYHFEFLAYFLFFCLPHSL